MYTFDDYERKPKCLLMEEFEEIHMDMLAEIETDLDAIELYQELVKKSVEYAAIRSKWLLMSNEEKMDADQGRTMKHDSLIIKFDQLARYLRMNGKKAVWRDKLGYEKDDKMNRKKIGDMGCYISFVYSLNAR